MSSNNNLTVAGVSIKQDSEGRFCLNDCHRASGGNESKRPSNWIRTQSIQDLIEELKVSSNMSAPVNIVKTGLNESRGIYASKEIVYAYAMWISPSFHLKVIHAYDALINHQTNCPNFLIPKTYSEALRLAAQQAEEIKQLEKKGQALDRISKSDGSLCITDAAKNLQIKPKDLFSFLQRIDWIYKRNGNSHWCAYQSKIKAGYIEQKTIEFHYSDGSTKIKEQVRITAKGLTKLSEMLFVDEEKAA